MFETIVTLARAALREPIAAVSLIDSHRQWFKAHSGRAVCDTARSVSFCSHTIQTRSPLLIHDTHADDYYSTNSLVVGAPIIAAYAGVPLASPDDYNVGALCAIDTVKRVFTLAQIDMMRGFATIVVKKLELRQQTRYDELTVLLTRSAIFALAAQELSRRNRHDRPTALLMFDTDRFRGVNDQRRHPGADEVLRHIPTSVEEALRRCDQIACVGGDEFMILLPETLPPEAIVVVERVRRFLLSCRIRVYPQVP